MKHGRVGVSVMWARVFGALLSALLLSPALASAGSPWGEPGTPVHLVVGYQPYYTAAWSGIVLRAKRFYERYLPAGSTVHWELGLHGPVILNALREGRDDLGYLGDVPAVAATARPGPIDLRLIAATGLSSTLCNSLLVRADAPAFANPESAINWIDGKRVAASFGGCSDRFAHELFARGHIRPAEYLNLTPTVLQSGFSAGRLDAAVAQEPVAEKLIAAGLARRVVTGADVGEVEGSFLVAPFDLIRERPDVVEAWLNAELDAELFMAVPEHASEIAAIAVSQTIGYDRRTLWTALYGDKDGGSRLAFPFAATDPVRALMGRAAQFLRDAGRLPDESVRAEAIDDAIARDLLQRRGLLPPVGEVVGRRIDDFDLQER